MQQYSVLLVDDEEDVIRVIMKKIDWERMGLRHLVMLHNGVEGAGDGRGMCPGCRAD